MTADLVPFTYEDAQLRTLTIDDEPWFVAGDAARILGYRDAHNLARRLDDDEKGTHSLSTPGGIQQVAIISESGLYSAILGSQVEKAKEIKRWVTGTVLPEIRKTGGYGIAALDLSDPIAAIEAANARSQAAVEIAKSERAARVEAEARAKELEAPASAWSHMADSTGDYDVADAAKVLTRDPAIKIGRDRLFSFMAAEGWIFRNRNTRWKAYQTQVDCGRLVEKLGTPFLHEPTGEMRVPDPTIRVTPKGLAELHKRLGGSGQLPLVASA